MKEKKPDFWKYQDELHANEKDKDYKIVLRIQPKFKEPLRAEALKHNTSVNRYIEALIQKAIFYV